MTPQCIYSMRAVLAYQILDAIDKPITYTSSSLLMSKRNYSYQEKEGLILRVLFEKTSCIYIWRAI